MTTLLPNLFFVGLGLYALAAVLSLIIPSHLSQKAPRFVSHGGAVLGSLSMLLFAGWFLATIPGVLSIKATMGLLPVAITIDPLAAFFIAVVGLLGICTSLYGISYMEHYEKKYSLAGFGAFFNVFLAAIILVATASHALFFLLVWELMSFASYLLIAFEHRESENTHAAFVYFVMTHIGTLLIAIGFFTLYRATGSFDFAVWRAGGEALSTAVRTVSFVLFLVGFGIKAGIIPLHIWLPKAHPAAPSHVSAMLSGVMIKVGVLMIIRFTWDILSGAPAWWGLLIIGLGALASVLGVLYALAEHDLKRLLAYHSIENIGIILLGLGAAIFFDAHGYSSLALLALAASLFHIMNHAIFKALLFLASGVVVRATHTRNIEEYGGLIKKLPITAFLFLVGALAISAMPPLNGFASEWLTFQSLFATINLAGAWGTVLGFVGIISLALTGGLAAACFVKAFGITFLARPRSAHSTHAIEHDGGAHSTGDGEHKRTGKDATPFELAGMGVLAFFTLLLGIGAKTVVHVLVGVGRSMHGGAATAMNLTSGTGAITVGMKLTSSLDLGLLFLTLVIVGAITGLLVFLGTRKRTITYSRTWDCGFPLSPRMVMTSTAFARALLQIFRGLVRPTKQHTLEYHDVNSRYLVKSHTVDLGVHNIYETWLYQPLGTAFLFLSDRIKKIQTGNVNTYVLYVFVTFIALLIYATWLH